MDIYKDSCCGARQLPRRQAPSSSADRAHNARSEREMHDLVNSLAHPTM